MHEAGKRTAGFKAAEQIENGMIVGLGTGTTAAYFIEALILRRAQGLHFRTVASSRASAELARKGGLTVIDINEAPRVDITADGADEIDPKHQMIKGGGGAHVREKILAHASKKFIAIVDESKCVPHLGKAKLPVEVLFFGSPSTRHLLEKLGYEGQWRTQMDGTFFITENGNLIFDIHLSRAIQNARHEHQKIIEVPGVVDTGLFFDVANQVIIGASDGSTRTVNTGY